MLNSSAQRAQNEKQTLREHWIMSGLRRNIYFFKGLMQTEACTSACGLHRKDVVLTGQSLQL